MLPSRHPSWMDSGSTSKKALVPRPASSRWVVISEPTAYGRTSAQVKPLPMMLLLRQTRLPGLGSMAIPTAGPDDAGPEEGEPTDVGAHVDQGVARAQAGAQGSRYVGLVAPPGDDLPADLGVVRVGPDGEAIERHPLRGALLEVDGPPVERGEAELGAGEEVEGQIEDGTTLEEEQVLGRALGIRLTLEEQAVRPAHRLGVDRTRWRCARAARGQRPADGAAERELRHPHVPGVGRHRCPGGADARRRRNGCLPRGGGHRRRGLAAPGPLIW